VVLWLIGKKERAQGFERKSVRGDLGGGKRTKETCELREAEEGPHPGMCVKCKKSGIIKEMERDRG